MLFVADDYTAATLKDILRKADIDYSQAEFDNRPWVDGTKPAETSVVIDPAPDRADIIADLKKACAAIGLGKPTGAEPTLICEGQGSSSISVFATLLCKERCYLVMRAFAP